VDVYAYFCGIANNPGFSFKTTGHFATQFTLNQYKQLQTGLFPLLGEAINRLLQT